MKANQRKLGKTIICCWLISIGDIMANNSASFSKLLMLSIVDIL